MIRLRDLVCKDPVALEKWPSIVDHIVPPGADQRRVKKNFTKDDDYEQAVLESLNLWKQWKGYGEKRADLLQVLRGRGLNALADKIETEEILLATELQTQKPETAQPCARDTSDIWFEVGDGTCSFTGRETELQNLHCMLTRSHTTKSVAANIVTICGLGGIGKSSLARESAHNHRIDYDGNVAWINAETVDSMKSAFVRLAARLGVPTSDQDSSHDIAQRVYQKFQDKKSLFIFDNVEEKTHFNEFLPKIENPVKQTPYILVTTRRNDVSQLPENQLSLGVLEMDEAVRLIREQVPHAEEGCAEKLAEALQRLPLALQQALAYIREKYTSDGDCISKFLKELKISERTLLEDERFKESNDYSLTTYATWTVTLARIKTMEGGEMATRAIEVLAYLNPDFITVQFLKNACKTEETPEMELGLKLLERFSMVTVKDGKITIHRLVQKVVRLDQSPDEQMCILNRITKASGLRFELDEFTEYTRERMSHGLHIFPCQMGPGPLSEFVTGKSGYLDNLCYFLIYYGNYSDCLSIAEQSSSTLESAVGAEHEHTIKMKWNAAAAHYYLKNYSKATEILESILPISQSSLGQEHWLTMNILNSMAAIHSASGDYQNAITICDEIIPVRLRLFGESHHSILSAQQMKARALRNLGRLDEALELLQYVYERRVELHGKNDLRTLNIMECIGHVLHSKGDLSTAIEMLTEVYEGRKLVIGEMHPDTIRAMNSVKHTEAAILRRSQSRCYFL